MWMWVKSCLPTSDIHWLPLAGGQPLMLSCAVDCLTCNITMMMWSFADNCGNPSSGDGARVVDGAARDATRTGSYHLSTDVGLAPLRGVIHTAGGWFAQCHLVVEYSAELIHFSPDVSSVLPGLMFDNTSSLHYKSQTVDNSENDLLERTTADCYPTWITIWWVSVLLATWWVIVLLATWWIIVLLATWWIHSSQSMSPGGFILQSAPPGGHHPHHQPHLTSSISLRDYCCITFPLSHHVRNFALNLRAMNWQLNEQSFQN